MASVGRGWYRYMQRQAHEQPVLFYSVVLGAIGPIMVPVVPAIRAKFGYKPPEPIPTSYPIPKRPRRELKGYDDES